MIGSPTKTVFYELLPSVHVQSVSVNPLTVNRIGLLKLMRLLSEPEFSQVQPKQTHLSNIYEVSISVTNV